MSLVQKNKLYNLPQEWIANWLELKDWYLLNKQFYFLGVLFPVDIGTLNKNEMTLWISEYNFKLGYYVIG